MMVSLESQKLSLESGASLALKLPHPDKHSSNIILNSEQKEHKNRAKMKNTLFIYETLTCQ